MDFIFIVDNACGYQADECEAIMESIAEFQQLIKGNTSPRFGLIQTSDTQPTPIISLGDSYYNDQDLMANNADYDPIRRDLYRKVAKTACLSTPTDTNLIGAIEAAIDDFAANPNTGVHAEREEKIVIFSSCKHTGGEHAVCHEFSGGIFDGRTD